MVGISRRGPDGRELVAVGKPIPPQLWSPEMGEPPALGAPRLINGAWVVVVSAPILGKDGVREGTDVLLFDAEAVRAHVIDVHNLGETGELVLGIVGPRGPEVFFPRRVGGGLVADAEVVRAFAAATDSEVTLRLPGVNGTLDAVLVKRLPGSDWIVMARQAVDELHRSIDQLVMMVAGGVVVLIAIGIGGFLLLLRPLTGRALVGTAELRQEIDERERAQQALERALESTIEAVASTIEMRDPYTAGHQRRVAEIAVAIGRELGLDEERLKGLHMAGTIHDIGKIAIPTELLTRPGRIGPVEMEIIRCHSRDACDILKGVEFPWPVADMVRHHHERMDGSGYPDGLRGDEIILEARILAVADVVEAIASDRPYRAALGLEAAMTEVMIYRGSRFDADVVDICCKLVAEGRLPLTGVKELKQVRPAVAC
ncbi:MAG: HD domain-containing protein [Magnetospirillum sp.]|nr:MAG: HD domain-containing protein [Magnetospirillum sp.]